MRAVFLLCVLLGALCEELHFFHYTEGQLVVNKEAAVKIDGPLYINFRQTMNTTLIAGMHIKGTVYTPFGFSAKITKFVGDKDNFKIEADCYEAAWGREYSNKLTGKISMEGSYQKATYNGTCTVESTKNSYSIVASGTYTPCRVLYTEIEAAKRAATLIGAKEELYKAVHVLDYAYLGYPYLNTVPNCKYYLDNFKEEAAAKPGFAIVGKDAAHCAIVDNEGDKFIHSNPAKKEVTINPLSMLKDYFPKGFVFKDVKC